MNTKHKICFLMLAVAHCAGAEVLQPLSQEDQDVYEFAGRFFENENRIDREHFDRFAAKHAMTAEQQEGIDFEKDFGRTGKDYQWYAKRADIARVINADRMQKVIDSSERYSSFISVPKKYVLITPYGVKVYAEVIEGKEPKDSKLLNKVVREFAQEVNFTDFTGRNVICDSLGRGCFIDDENNSFVDWKIRRLKGIPLWNHLDDFGMDGDRIRCAVLKLNYDIIENRDALEDLIYTFKRYEEQAKEFGAIANTPAEIIKFLEDLIGNKLNDAVQRTKYKKENCLTEEEYVERMKYRMSEFSEMSYQDLSVDDLVEKVNQERGARDQKLIAGLLHQIG